MAWHLAELQLEIVGKCANSVRRLVEFGGDVLDFWWGVLLVSGPPTIRNLFIVGLERVVDVFEVRDPIILFLNSLLGLLLQRTAFELTTACCSCTCDKEKGGDFLHIKIYFKSDTGSSIYMSKFQLIL